MKIGYAEIASLQSGAFSFQKIAHHSWILAMIKCLVFKGHYTIYFFWRDGPFRSLGPSIQPQNLKFKILKRMVLKKLEKSL